MIVTVSRVDRGWTVVVPVKHSAAAKSRLASRLGPWRAPFARALAMDTVEAALGSTSVDRVVVVGDELRTALETIGARVIADPTHGADLNAAITAGLRVARPGPVAVLTADLPALRAQELTAALSLAADHALSVTGDAEGTGTTMLACTHGHVPVPRFGPRSFARHVADGATVLAGGPGLARDVDVYEHIAEASMLGFGRRTGAVLSKAGLL